MFLCFLAIFVRYVYYEAGASCTHHHKAKSQGVTSAEAGAPPHAMGKSVLFVIMGLVMGNVLGSNILNIFFTLRITSLILPIPLDPGMNTVVLVNIAATALILTELLMNKNNTLGRGMGALLLFI